jgi:hypothetical protein
MHRLSQDPVADARLQALRRAEVDSATKEILKMALKFHEPEQPDGSVELDQQVHVTVLSRFIACDRAKEGKTRHAEACAQHPLMGS